MLRIIHQSQDRRRTEYVTTAHNCTEFMVEVEVYIQVLFISVLQIRKDDYCTQRYAWRK